MFSLTTEMSMEVESTNLDYLRLNCGREFPFDWGGGGEHCIYGSLEFKIVSMRSEKRYAFHPSLRRFPT